MGLSLLWSVPQGYSWAGTVRAGTAADEYDAKIKGARPLPVFKARRAEGCSVH